MTLLLEPSLINGVKSTMDGNSNTITITNHVDELERMSAWVNELIPNYGLSTKTLFAVELVLTEMVTNIISYAYKGRAKRAIQIELHVQEDSVQLILIDDGRPFNPLQDYEINIPPTLEKSGSGGLGIHLMKSYTDESRYQRKDNHNILEMWIKTASP